MPLKTTPLLYCTLLYCITILYTMANLLWFRLAFLLLRVFYISLMRPSEDETGCWWSTCWNKLWYGTLWCWWLFLSNFSIYLTVTIIILGIVMPLYRLDVVSCFGNYFRYSPVYYPFLVCFSLETSFIGYIGNCFRYSPHKQTLSDLFSKRFYWLSLWVIGWS